MNVSTQYAHAFARALPLEQLAVQVPAAFTDHAAPHTSSNYVFISTRQLVSALLEAGFIATDARQSSVRRGTSPVYARHMLRFQPLRTEIELHEVVPQIVLINSHDGRGCYRLTAGLYRPVCRNGLLTALGDFGLIHVPHRGNIVQNVVEAALRIIHDFSRVGEVIEQMRGTAMSWERRIEFAQQALQIRYSHQQHHPFAPAALLEARRDADQGEDLFTVFNVVQENIIRGGIAGRSALGRVTHSRGIRAIPEDVRINSALWQLALTMIRT